MTTTRILFLGILGLCFLCDQEIRAQENTSLQPADCLTKILRSAKPKSVGARFLELSGARGEIASGQVVFYPKPGADSASCSASDLKNEYGSIPSSNIKLQWARYIDVTRNTEGVPDDELIAKAPCSIPDPFWEGATVQLVFGEAQPLWIEVHIPRDAKPGDYSGKVQVSSANEIFEIPLSLHVWNFEMPKDRRLSVMNWWNFPGLGFQDRVKPYSDDYWKLLAEFCLFLVEHRQTEITGSIMSLVLENTDSQGKLTYDTSLLERYAETAFDAGVHRIHLHAVGDRTAPHLDPASRIVPIDAALERLPSLENLMKKRGWQKRFLISVCDEPFAHHEESYAALVKRIHELAPNAPCVEAVEAEFLGDLDIYIPKLSHINLWYPRFQELKREGKEVWFYVCCHPVGRYPNRFLDQSLLKARVLFWISYLYDLDGYLHWGLNHFNGKDAYSDQGIGGNLPPGDCAIAYPGKTGLIGSLRFSAQRDGIQDYEYLRLLEDGMRKVKAHYGDSALWLDPKQRPLELCRRIVQSFYEHTRNPIILLETRKEIAGEIEALEKEPLLIVQTSPPEETFIPAGPRHLTVRGLVTLGATVTINGQPVGDVRESGYFTQVLFLENNQERIHIEAKLNGKKSLVKRRFPVND
ncbi:DUF4091 domain-containing protein [Candidatus Sumerlaeota bacterium]|nr:DUF4091 domain-containing protein [Candidatus Sumerlaeota bacterium]